MFGVGVDVRNAVLRVSRQLCIGERGLAVEGRQVNGEGLRKGSGCGSTGRPPETSPEF